jgi:[acyl-carrier-protein] S-malonyltransferase
MPKTAFLFPGQGAQSVGMGVANATTYPAAAALFDSAKQILGYDLLELCRSGPVERLNATDISQPAIFVCSLAALEALKATEPDSFGECVATAGLSLGEYTALWFAEAIDFESALQVVQKRGQAMQAASEATPSGMSSVLVLEIPQVEELVAKAKSAGRIEIANYLCPGNTVISGEFPALDLAERLASEAGGTAKRLAVAGAFHTELMKPADGQLLAALNAVTVKTPKIPVWSNVDAATHTDPDEIRNILVQQTLSPVRWEQSMRALLDQGVERFYEIGPGKVLAGLMKRISRKTDFRNIAG